MSIISVDLRSGTVRSAQRPRDFWQRLALAVDRYLASRARLAVPQAALRRSRQDFERCRRLMHKA
jgi:hypothetical protein